MESGTYAVSFSIGGAVPRTRSCTIVVRDGVFSGDDGEFSYRGTLSGDGCRVRAVVEVQPSGSRRTSPRRKFTLGGMWAMSGFSVEGYADARREIPVRAIGIRQPSDHCPPSPPLPPAGPHPRSPSKTSAPDHPALTPAPHHRHRPPGADAPRGP